MSKSCCEIEVKKSCESGHCHDDHKDDKDSIKLLIIRLIVSTILALIAYYVTLPLYLTVGLFAVAYLIVAYDIVFKAFRNLFKGKWLDENSLMTIASIGAFLIFQMEEAVAVIIFYQLGEMLQNMAVNRSRRNITELMDIRPDTANLKQGNKITVVDPQEVEIGSIILVKSGERVPLDGIIVKGSSLLDTMALTGESLPQSVSEGDQILSGMINLTGSLEFRVTKNYKESTATKILELVESAGERKADSEQFITKFAKVYTPTVVLLAFLVIVVPPLLNMGTQGEWWYKGLSFLIISCPCALVISIPLSFFGGIGGAARQGILVKGGNYLEDLNGLKTIVFDKTGTLTAGNFKVIDIINNNKASEEEILKYAAWAESHSSHPIARSIVEAYGEEINEEISVEEKIGYGVIAVVNKDEIVVGSAAMLREIGIKDLPEEKNLIHVARNKEYLGHLIIGDQGKDNLQASLSAIRKSGVDKLIILSGDQEEIVRELASESGFNAYYGGLLPQDKVNKLEEIMASNQGKTAFVGDGINDAPVLKRADIGIAMGGIGSDAAIEAADIVIMNDDISKLSTAMRVAKKTRSIVIQNIAMALGVKIIIMILAFLGITSIWLAIMADVGVALLALLNAVRALRIQDK